MESEILSPIPSSLGRDEKIRTLRFLCKKTLDDLSLEFGLSRERIRQICKPKEQRMEPFYIRQTANPSDIEARQNWFRNCTDEAKSEGAQHIRYSISHDGNVILTEAWREKNVGDEGNPRFSFSAQTDPSE